MQQCGLFSETPQRPPLIKSPWCIRADKHCGYQATQGAPQTFGATVNTVITCVHCKREGVMSERTDLPRDGRKGRT
jgi:hypothetical protein